MSPSPVERSRRAPDDVEEHPLRGGATGIALVALATLAVTIAAAIVVVVALALVG